MWCHTHWGRDRVQLLMTDTDSLMLKVKKTKDIWADIKAFNREHENWIEDEGNPRNGQLGVFKSETGKDPIMSFVGLRAKMYSFVTESDHKEHMKAKGVSKEALTHLHHEDYVKCLKEGTSNSVRMESIRSYEQQLYTVELFKKGLSCNDVKRWICGDGIETRPYGYNPSEEEKGDVEMKEEDKDMEIEDN